MGKAHRDFLVHAGYGTGLTNTRHYRLLWKNLFKLRQGGVEKILLYRTKEFDSFCESFSSNTHPTLLDTVTSWEEKYGPQISLLERRIANAAEKELSEDPLLSQPDIAKLLKVSRKAWNNDTSCWRSEQEAESFEATRRMLLAGRSSPGGLQDIPTKIGEERERCLFVVLKPRGVEEIMVCPIITIKPGDFLGIFSGELRYSNNFDEAHGVPGPWENFWLDYSRVTGVLNLARVALSDEVANVCLQWESYKSEKRSPAVWRIAVRATRVIKPFEEITRSACHERQFEMRGNPAFAKRGYLKANRYEAD